MIKLSEGGVYLVNGKTLFPEKPGVEAAIQKIFGQTAGKEAARRGTMSYAILTAHNRGGGENLRIAFDCLASHDLTYVGVIQTALASGLKQFPLPYVLTNCHNSLCIAGGTLNEDDHRFGLSAAKKYGGVFVPPHLAVIHAYMREMYAACG
ncbi:MAG: hydratase, partial [Treponema sp.]|nr:hydratase [Treponema sp.]